MPISVQAQSTPPPAKPPEYENNLRNLADVMGGLHYLSTTCDDPNSQTWRTNMQALLDREGPAGAPIRIGMIGAFNDGYKAQQTRFPSCSPAARSAKKYIGAKGRDISRALAGQNY